MPGRKITDDLPENNNPSDTLPISPDLQTVRKRGRPKGSRNSIKTKRPDRVPITEAGENTKYLNHDLRLLKLPKIDVNDSVALMSRVEQYFSICAEDDMKPSIASFALALGVSRVTLFMWITGKVGTIKNPESINAIKTAYDTINSYYEHLMNNGRINPVAGIFLMKNNMGYKDTTDYVINSGNDDTMRISDITDRAGILLSDEND